MTPGTEHGTRTNMTAGWIALAALALPAATEANPISWIHDDWEAARKDAIAGKKLIAIDVWATWCHTCLSMKHYTLQEAPLKRVAEQHTWLSLDFDKTANAAFFTPNFPNAHTVFANSCALNCSSIPGARRATASISASSFTSSFANGHAAFAKPDALT